VDTTHAFEVVVVDARPVSHAGSGRLAELADRLGLSRALGQFAGSGGRARRPKPATVLCDLILLPKEAWTR
jgi:hypothetical protein